MATSATSKTTGAFFRWISDLLEYDFVVYLPRWQDTPGCGCLSRLFRYLIYQQDNWTHRTQLTDHRPSHSWYPGYPQRPTPLPGVPRNHPGPHGQVETTQPTGPISHFLDLLLQAASEPTQPSAPFYLRHAIYCQMLSGPVETTDPILTSTDTANTVQPPNSPARQSNTTGPR
jgi:hypothetical protein